MKASKLRALVFAIYALSFPAAFFIVAKFGQPDLHGNKEETILPMLIGLVCFAPLMILLGWMQRIAPRATRILLVIHAVVLILLLVPATTRFAMLLPLPLFFALLYFPQREARRAGRRQDTTTHTMNPPADVNPPAWMLPAILVAFPIFFCALWSGICLLLSAIGNWKGIAAKYPGSQRPTGTRFPMVTGYVGVVSYRNCLKVHVAPEGLHVAVWKIFGLGHSPLFILWGEIRNASTRNLLFAENVVFEIGAPKVGKMQLPKKVFEGQPIALDGAIRGFHSAIFAEGVNALHQSAKNQP